jgi:hypothetical protein
VITDLVDAIEYRAICRGDELANEQFGADDITACLLEVAAKRLADRAAHYRQVANLAELADQLRLPV